MVQGKLEVLLVGAKGLENSDYLKDMDTYAVLKFCSQEQRSSIASGKGVEPEWNESFIFTVSNNVSEFKIKLMDSDSGSQDDFVGEVDISLEPLFAEGELPPTVYNVVKDEEYKGEIKVGFTFTPEETRDRSYGEENYGGWNESG